ncbi:MAG: hypothetical protein WBV27_08115 [Trichococcus sp.]|uniref:hypothetical protein n=1 Tax=Trichococcus sp. TaxID=1985464 RepID=UPI003C4C2092
MPIDSEIRKGRRTCELLIVRDLMEYVCTINEANMGLQIAAVDRDMMIKMGVTPQIVMNLEDNQTQ